MSDANSGLAQSVEKLALRILETAPVKALALYFAARYPMLMDAVIADRQSGRLPNERFVDSYFLDLMRDPVGRIRKMYGQLSLEFTDSFAADIVRYLREKPQGKFGKHRYSIDDMGIDVADFSARCQNYRRHFGVGSES